MILDLTRLLSGEINRMGVDFDLSTEMDDGYTAALDGVEFTSLARVRGEITDNAGYMRLSLTVSLDYRGECARCLAPVDGVFSLDFERTVTTEGTISEDRLDELEDEYVVIRGSLLDVDQPLLEELVLGFPSRLLCEEDCPGLCPKCGKPKREGDCGCPTKEINPHFAILANFFDDDDEEDKK